MSVVAVDRFASNVNISLDAPLVLYGPITPSDTDDLVYVSRAVLIGTAGTFKVQRLDGTTMSFASGDLAAGVWHPLRVKRIYNTGTGASNIWAGD